MIISVFQQAHIKAILTCRSIKRSKMVLDTKWEPSETNRLKDSLKKPMSFRLAVWVLYFYRSTRFKYVEIMYSSNEPYNDLPLLPQKMELETKKILRQAIAALRVLAELKGRADEIPNQSVGIKAITLREARDSSEMKFRTSFCLTSKRWEF